MLAASSPPGMAAACFDEWTGLLSRKPWGPADLSGSFDEALAELTNSDTKGAEQAASWVSPGAAVDQRQSVLAERLRNLREQAGKLVEEIEALQKEAAPK